MSPSVFVFERKTSAMRVTYFVLSADELLLSPCMSDFLHFNVTKLKKERGGVSIRTSGACEGDYFILATILQNSVSNFPYMGPRMSEYFAIEMCHPPFIFPRSATFKY